MSSCWFLLNNSLFSALRAEQDPLKAERPKRLRPMQAPPSSVSSLPGRQVSKFIKPRKQVYGELMNRAISLVHTHLSALMGRLVLKGG